jgi:hypothetical protein
MFVLNMLGRFAAHDVVGEVQKFLEGKVKIMESIPCLTDLDPEHLFPPTIP